MKTKWQMVRLDESTHRRLAAFLETYRGWKGSDGKTRKIPRYSRPSLADAVAELLDRVEKHKARSRKSGKRDNGQLAADQAGEVAPDHVIDQASFVDRLNASIANGEPFEPVLDME